MIDKKNLKNWEVWALKSSGGGGVFSACLFPQGCQVLCSSLFLVEESLEDSKLQIENILSPPTEGVSKPFREILFVNSFSLKTSKTPLF